MKEGTYHQSMSIRIKQTEQKLFHQSKNNLCLGTSPRCYLPSCLCVRLLDLLSLSSSSSVTQPQPPCRPSTQQYIITYQSINQPSPPPPPPTPHYHNRIHCSSRSKPSHTRGQNKGRSVSKSVSWSVAAFQTAYYLRY